MLPLSSSRSSTFLMSNCAYFASRTPSATFSKSQNRAMLVISGWAAMCRSFVSQKLLSLKRLLLAFAGAQDTGFFPLRAIFYQNAQHRAHEDIAAPIVLAGDAGSGGKLPFFDGGRLVALDAVQDVFRR